MAMRFLLLSRCPKNPMDVRIACLVDLVKLSSGFKIAIVLELFLLASIIVNSNFYILARSSFEKEFSESSTLVGIFEIAFYDISTHLLKYLNNMLQYMCEYETEAFISHRLLQNTQDTSVDEFLKSRPEEHYTEFLTRKEAFTKLTSILVFSIPMNLFFVMHETYKIVSSRGDSFKVTVLSAITLILIYSALFFKAIFHRHKLRRKYNQRKVEKNKSCRHILDAFEVIKADSREDCAIECFREKLLALSREELKYLVLSEVYRFIMRFSVLALKVLFILLRILGSSRIGLREIILRINFLNRSLLALRNDCFMLMEYWNESCFLPAHPRSGSRPFKLNHSISVKDVHLIKEGKSDLKDVDFALNKDETENSKGVHSKDVCEGVEKFARPQNRLAAERHDFDSSLCDPLVECFNQKDVQDTKLYKMNFSIPAGKKTLILGPAGSGKSLILKVILGIHQYRGHIAFDNCELNQVSPESMFCNMSYLSQCQYVFNKSISFNILYGTGLNFEEAIKRLRFFGLFGYFSQFKNGFNTIVGGKSCGLSNGQKQFICFCRCILKECSVYLLDEPSSFLDAEAERLIYSAIRCLRDKTVIVSSKFGSQAKDFDTIIKINK